MEGKLSQREFLFLQYLNYSSNPKPTCLSQSFCFKSPLRFTKHFRVHSQRWRSQIQGMSKGQHSTKNFLVHVVKEGETLSWISKLYGVSIYEIAATNKDIVDVDLVLEGQRLNIPSAAQHPQKCQTGKRRLHSSGSMEKLKSCLDFSGGHSNQNIFSVLSSHHLQYAKTTGYFLVLVPCIAFCIRCVIGVFHVRLARNMKHQPVNESEAHHGSRSMRWKFALSDMTDPDILDAEPRHDSNHEDAEEFACEDTGYRKVEHDYQLFLSECGMSKWGYWRGGSPE